MASTLIVWIAAVSSIGGSSARIQEPRTVVFVCEHGAAKSVIAAAHFNRLAKERELPFRAISRGTVPD
ncbi:MAG: hypothetical protein ACRD21_14045, partial [Vicinamibacteria bacterium]